MIFLWALSRLQAKSTVLDSEHSSVRCLMDTGWITCTLWVFSPLSVDFELILWDQYVCSFKSFWAFPCCCNCFGGLTPSAFLCLSFCLSVCLSTRLPVLNRANTLGGRDFRTGTWCTQVLFLFWKLLVTVLQFGVSFPPDLKMHSFLFF